MSTSSKDQPLSRFPVPKFDWKIIGAYVVANLLILLIFVTSIQEPISQGKSIPMSSILIFLLIVALWGIGNYFVYQWYQNRIHRIDVYEDKIVINRKKSTREITLDEIEGVTWNYYRVTQGKKVKTVTEIIIVLKENKLRFLSDFLPKLEKLGELLEERIAEKYLDVTVEKLQAGESVSFGIVKLNLEGLTFEEHDFQWDIIGGLVLHEGNLVIVNRNEEPIALVPQNQILNIQLLGLIANEMIEALDDGQEREDGEDEFLDDIFEKPLFD